MILPIKNNIKIDKKYRFERAIETGLGVQVEKGQKVTRDTVLASGEVYEEKSRIDISSKLGVNPTEAVKYMQCLNGERIDKGEIIAMKSKKIIKKEKKVEASSSGVINLSDLDSGIVKIFAEAKESTLRSGVSGKVVSVLKDKKVIIECKVIRFLPFVVYGRDVQGDVFHFDSKKKNVEIGSNLADGIVSLDYNPTADELREFAMAGVKGIILSTIDDELRQFLNQKGIWGMTICSFNGFGRGKMSSDNKKIIENNDGFLIYINSSDNEIVFSNVVEDWQINSQVAKIKLGDKIQFTTEKGDIRYGEIKEVGSSFSTVKSGKEDYSINNLNLLKIYETKD